MSNTVNISRHIWEDDAFKPEPFTEREAFVWMIMEASYKPRKKRIGNLCFDLSRGQLASSVRFMAEAWNWKKSTVDRFLKRLKNRDMIGTDSGTGLNVITICKYEFYQNKTAELGTEGNKRRDSSGTAAGQQWDKPNTGLIPEVIKNKNIDDFEAFWAIVPVKVGRAVAEKAYAKAVKQAAPELILAGMKAYAASRVGQDAKFTAHPATWLNAGRWADEAPKPAKSSGPEHGAKMLRRSDGHKMVFCAGLGEWIMDHS